MKNIRVALCSLILPLLCVSAFPLRAQTGSDPIPLSPLDVSVGDAFEYEGLTRTETEGTIPFTDSTQTVVNEVAMINVMEVSEITDDEIIWEMSAVASLADNVTNGVPQQMPIVTNIVTDRQGRLKKLDAGGVPGIGSMSMMMGGANGSAQGPGWFLPSGLTERKIGETWTETSNDTATIAVMAGINLDLVVSVTITYTYDGALDTLGVRAARLRWAVDEMSMDGSFDVPDTEMTMSMSGSGSGSGTSYYSLQDRLVLAQVSDMVMDQDLDMGAIGSQSMTIRMHSEQGRQD